ncbi:MAG: DNA polymerase III subunit beta [Myxococcales bacterium]|nr:MAG: DNA polymerase III subunit beta [Myxococcales bacterium]
MEFTIHRTELLKGLAKACPVSDKKSSMPILSNVLINADKDLEISATDLYLSVKAHLNAEIKKKGTIAVSARTLLDIAKNLPDAEIHWKVSKGNTSEIQCGKVKYKLPGINGDDFPSLPEPGKAKFFEIDAAILSEMIGLTQYSMSHDDTRPHLAGALFEGDGDTIRMVTTDGHRLSKAEQVFSGSSSKFNFSMLIPSKGVGELKRLIEDSKSAKDESTTVEVASVGGNAFFKKDGFMLSVKLTEEQFPPYAKVIPQSPQRNVGFARTPFMEALKRISLVANDKSGGVRFQLDSGIVRITSENPDIGEGSEEVAVDFAGEPLTVGFNARYMLDVLSSLKHDDIVLGLGGELDPGVIRPADTTDFVGVIMPMRI